MRKGVNYLGDAIDRLKSTGAAVFVVPCIDLNIVSSLGQPLRFVLGSISRHYSIMQGIRATLSGAHVIDTTPIHGAFKGRGMYSADFFHPSSMGYRHISEYLIKQIKLKVDIV